MVCFNSFIYLGQHLKVDLELVSANQSIYIWSTGIEVNLTSTINVMKIKMSDLIWRTTIKSIESKFEIWESLRIVIAMFAIHHSKEYISK